MPTADQPSATAGPASFWAVVCIYAVSGAAGLAWQVVWVRAFTPVFGAGLEAIAAVTAVFLTGLGIGGALGGRWAQRWPGMRLYAVCEALVGGWGAALPWLLAASGGAVVAVLARTGDGTLGTVVRLGVAGILVGPPAVLLGVTFPAVAAAVSAERSPHRVGWLYGLNALGAAAGALVAGLWLPWALGITAGSAAVGAVNVLVAGVAWWIPGAPPERHRRDVPTRAPGALWLVAGASGLVGLGLEVTWSRLASPLLAARFDGDAGAFAGVLAAVLVGIGLGGVFARNAGTRRPARALGIAQAVLAALTLATLEPVRALFLPSAGTRVLESLLPFLPALALGATFPILTTTLLRAEASARRLGALYAVNTLAAAAGSLLCAFVLVPGLGAQRTAAVLALGASAIAVMALAWGRDHRLGIGVAPLVLVAVVMVAVAPPVAGERLLLPDERVLAAVEGRQTTTLVVGRPDGERLLVSGGHRIASANRARIDDHALRATGPASLAVAPRRVLLIGLGTGETARAFLDWPGVEAVACVEIDANQRALLQWFGTAAILDDPRFRLIATDGRHFLRTHTETWDVIAVDAYGPRTASAAFYTREFYAEARARLAPRGFAFIKLDPLSMPDPPTLAAYLGTFFDGFPTAMLVYLEAGLFGLLGAEDSGGLQLQGRIIAAEPVGHRRAGLPGRVVTDDHPVAVPLVLKPNPEVLRPWWKAQQRSGRLPWASGPAPAR